MSYRFEKQKDWASLIEALVFSISEKQLPMDSTTEPIDAKKDEIKKIVSEISGIDPKISKIYKSHENLVLKLAPSRESMVVSAFNHLLGKMQEHKNDEDYFLHCIAGIFLLHSAMGVDEEQNIEPEPLTLALWALDDAAHSLKHGQEDTALEKINTALEKLTPVFKIEYSEQNDTEGVFSVQVQKIDFPQELLRPLLGEDTGYALPDFLEKGKPTLLEVQRIIQETILKKYGIFCKVVMNPMSEEEKKKSAEAKQKHEVAQQMEANKDKN